MILGEMRAELQRRLGFASSGASVTQNKLLLDDILKASQEQLFFKYDFPELRRVVDTIVLGGQRFFDYPADCELRRLDSVAVKLNSVWVPMRKGIYTQHDSYANLNMYPYRYDTAQMIELYPIPNKEYTIRVEYMANLLPFTQDDHVCTLDSRLVLTHAIVEAKAHYGHQDVGLYQRQLSEMIRDMQSAAHNGNEYSRSSKKDITYEPLPVRV